MKLVIRLYIWRKAKRLLSISHKMHDNPSMELDAKNGRPDEPEFPPTFGKIPSVLFVMQILLCVKHAQTP